LAVQNSLDLILLLTIDKSCGWRRRRSSAKDRIRRGRGQLDYREDGDMTPAASPRISKGPQKHTIAFRSKHVYFEHKHIKNHQYQ
jgi:hypothetical protein